MVAATIAAFVVVPVSAIPLLAVGVVLEAVAVRSAVAEAVVVAAAQQKAGGGQGEESLGGARISNAHHCLPWGALFASGGT